MASRWIFSGWPSIAIGSIAPRTTSRTRNRINRRCCTSRGGNLTMLTESPGMASAPAVEERSGSVLSYRALLLLCSLETLAISFARLSESMRFDRFAFCDHGANLTLQYLIAQGLRPSIDFGYHYGLLPALVGRIWFGLFGATPWSYQAAMVIAELLCAWAIAKILSQLKVGGVGLALAFITLGYA